MDVVYVLDKSINSLMICELNLHIYIGINFSFTQTYDLN